MSRADQQEPGSKRRPTARRAPAPYLILRSSTAAFTLGFLLSGSLLAGSIFGFRFLLFPAVTQFTGMGEPWHTLMSRTGVLLVAVGGYWISVKATDRGPVSELRPHPLGLALGAGSGFVLMSIPLAILFATGQYEILAWRGFGRAAGVSGTIFVAAMLEEILFRGFLFQRVEDLVGSVWAVTSVSALFGTLHLFNQGAQPMTLVSVTLLGALWTSIFVASRNLWLVGAHHCAWNMAIFLSGVPLSGGATWQQNAPLETVASGPAWATGGSFGPENSLLTIVLVAGAFLAVWGWARRNGRLRTRRRDASRHARVP